MRNRSNCKLYDVIAAEENSDTTVIQVVSVYQYILTITEEVHLSGKNVST